MKIIEATTPDEIEEACLQTGSFSNHTKGLKSWVADGSVVLFVAKNSKKYIGRVELRLSAADEVELREKFPDVPTLVALQVNPGAHREGVGTELVNMLLTKAKLLGHKQICLGVEENNFPAREMYEKLGFEYEGTSYESCWQEPDGEGSTKKICVDATLMMKELE